MTASALRLESVAHLRGSSSTEVGSEQHGENRMSNDRAYERAYEAGRTFQVFLETAEANRELWHAMAARATVHDPALERISAARGHWRLLVLADDWCGDAVNTLPVVARLAEAAPNLELRLLGREEMPELMDRHLTHGARSIPVVILLDEAGVERGWWAPRPRPLQEWFERLGRGMEKTLRYRELRRWYARDRGVTTANEIADLVRCGAEGDTAYEGTRPCAELRAA